MRHCYFSYPFLQIVTFVLSCLPSPNLTTYLWTNYHYANILVYGQGDDKCYTGQLPDQRTLSFMMDTSLFTTDQPWNLLRNSYFHHYVDLCPIATNILTIEHMIKCYDMVSGEFYFMTVFLSNGFVDTLDFHLIFIGGGYGSQKFQHLEQYIYCNILRTISEKYIITPKTPSSRF